MRLYAISFIRLLFALILFAIIVSCGNGSSTQTNTENAIFEFVVNIDSQNSLQIIAVWETKLPAGSKVEYRESGVEGNWISTRSFDQKVTKHEIVIVGLKAATTYVIRPVSDSVVGDEVEITTGGMPSFLPSTSLVDNSTNSSINIVIGGLPYPVSTIIAVNKEGKIIWYHTDSDGGDPGNFIVSPIDGRLLYNTYEKIKAVDYLGNEEVLLDIASYGDVCHHDFLVKADNTFMYLNRKTVYVGNSNVCVDEIIERDAYGNELWRWNTADHYLELGGYESSEGFISDCGKDWSHANSIQLNVDNQGHSFVLLSLRNLDRIVKIDYPSGDIIWQLGKGLDFVFIGSEAEDIQWFLRQHSARYYSDLSSVLLFDNGNDRYTNFSENFSRAIMYELDEVNMTAKIKWKYDFKSIAEHSGNVQRLTDGTFLITFPTNKTMTYAAFVQVDAAGNRLWQTDFAFSSPLVTNFLLGNLNILSLYNLYKQ